MKDRTTQNQGKVEGIEKSVRLRIMEDSYISCNGKDVRSNGSIILVEETIGVKRGSLDYEKLVGDAISKIRFNTHRYAIGTEYTYEGTNLQRID